MDSIRGIVGALATLVGLSLAISPRLPGHGPGPQIAVVAVCDLVAATCIGTANSKGGVALGIVLIAAFRLLVAGIFFLTGAHGSH